MVAVLTQKATPADRAARQAAIAARRADYQWVITGALPPYLNGLPKGELDEPGARHQRDTWVNVYQKMAQLGIGAATTLLDPRTSPQLVQFDDLYTGQLRLPPVNRRWRWDEEFGRQRLNGVNPLLIERCTKLPENFPVTEETVRASLPAGKTLAGELAEGRIFILDYQVLDGLPTEPGNYLTAPLCLLRLNEKGQLLPLAIQLGQSPAAGPIFTPADKKTMPWLWLFTKMHVQSADAAFHELSSHLLRTHLTVEVFWVSAIRNLSTQHPIYQLLLPHVWYTLCINHRARTELLCPGGPIALTMSAGYDGSVELLKRSYKTWTYNDTLLKNDLRRRGVDDPKALPGYYYRDDALIVWDAIERWITAFVNYYYPTAAEVAGDAELQAWMRELIDPAVGAVRGLPNNGALRGPADLAEVLTYLIFIATAEHGAVNNGQCDYFGYIPNLPAMMRMPPLKEKKEITQADVFRSLPNYKLACLQIGVVHMLSQPPDPGQTLGSYRDDFFASEPFIRAEVAKFKADLATISTKIGARNDAILAQVEEAEKNGDKFVDWTYHYLDPKQIPQSIAI